jgi:RHS repeat-associated protein
MRWKFYGPDLNGRFGGLQGTGGLEATILDSGGTTQGVINDQFGNGIASVAGGVATWFATRVGAYGPLPGSQATTLTDITQLAAATAWRGRRIDPTGFYNLGARYYEPTSGRFLSADPLGQAASPSLYDFAGGDPVNFFDPDGRIFGTPLSFGEFAGAVGSGLLQGAGNVAFSAVTAPYRFGSAVVSGYQQIGGLAGEALTGGLNSDVSLLASHPINTIQVTGEAAVQTAVQIGTGVVQQAQTSQGLANLSTDLAFGLAAGSAGLQTLNGTASTSYFWSGRGTQTVAENLARDNGG